MQVSVNVPDSLPNQPKISQHMLEAYVADLFRQGVISRGVVKQALGFADYWDTMNFLSSKNAIEYTKECFLQDLEYVKSEL